MELGCDDVVVIKILTNVKRKEVPYEFEMT